MAITMAITTNAAELNQRLSNIVARQLPYATARALTATAHQVRDAVKADMQAKFDRPTPFTMNAWQVVPARKDKLTAEVKLKDQIGAMSPNHYLETQVHGGIRPAKPMEQTLAYRLPVPYPVAAVVPGEGAQLNAYGNWSQGQRQRVLSALQAQRDPLANAARRGKVRRDRATTYFVPTSNRGEGLPPGIYARRGKQLLHIATILSSLPAYMPRLDFYGEARRTAEAKLPDNLARALEQALATAR